MRTTKDQYGTPRILVSISNESKKELVEKEITTVNGEKVILYTKAPSYFEVDKWELSVKIGKVVGISPGVVDIQEGDLVLLDYIVDADESFAVTVMENGDKIVCVPCLTTFHDEEIVATSYITPIHDDNGKVVKLIKTGEKNSLVAAKGDVDQVSLVLGVVRNGELRPNPFYLFCEQRQAQSGLIVNPFGLFVSEQPEEGFIKRKVLFSHPDCKYQPGDFILAHMNSDIELTLFEKTYDIVCLHDILAKE